MAEGAPGREQGKQGTDRNGGRLDEKSDLLLDAPQLKADKINLSIAKILDLEVEGLEAQLCLEADLENIVSLLNRLVSVVGDNPKVLQSLLDAVREAIATASEAVEETVDEAGDETGAAPVLGLPDRAPNPGMGSTGASGTRWTETGTSLRPFWTRTVKCWTSRSPVT